MQIIGITGTIGAGKGTIVDYLVTNHGFEHYSVRSYLTTEIHKRNLPLNRDSMVEVANELRSKYSPSYIIEQLYEQASACGKDCIIESIRTIGEAEALKKKENFQLFAIDADPKVRYERVVGRNSETDQISYETFLENEEREMSSNEPHKQNLSACIALSDYQFENNNSIDNLYQKLEETIHEIKNYC